MSSQTLAHLSNNLIYSAIAVYVLAMLGFAAEVAAVRGTTSEGRADRLGRTGVSLTVLACALHAGGVVLRALAAGRVPWGNMYEFSITGSLAVTVAYLALLRRYSLRYLGVLVVPAVLLTLGLAVTVLYTEAAQLVPALKSYWLVVHVSMVVLAAGVFTSGAALSVLYLLKARAERRSVARIPAASSVVPGRVKALAGAGSGSLGAGGSSSFGSVPAMPPPLPMQGWLGRLPSAERLDQLAYRVHAFAFPIFTFAVMAGAIWAENAWGRYWGWDPKETWAFITWVLYAAYLHARATAGWRGGRAATVALLGCAALWFNYYGVNLWFSGLHSYAGVG